MRVAVGECVEQQTFHDSGTVSARRLLFLHRSGKIFRQRRFPRLVLAHGRRIHPEATHNQRGVPRWDGSKAQRLLRLDMDEGKHKNTKPMELFNSRPEYYEKYELKVFRGHICQEQRKRKLVARCKNKK